MDGQANIMMSKVGKTRNVGVDLFMICFAVLVFFGVLYPYWFAGKFSTIGWQDEVSGHIPWNHVFLNDRNNFLHGFGGGVGRGSPFVVDQFSLYRFLLVGLPSWMAGLLIRALNLLIGFLGMFFIGRKIFGRSAAQSFLISILTVLTSYIVYGWTLGGHLFDFSCLLWMILILFLDVDFKTKIIFACLGGLIIPFVVAPIFVPIFLGGCIMFMFFLLGKKNFFERFSVGVFVFFIMVFSAWMIFNWQNILVTIDASREGFRFSLGINQKLNLLENTLEYFKKLSPWIHRLTNPIGVAEFILFLILLPKRRYWYFGLVVSSIVLLPLLLDSLAKLSNIPMFSTYRWDVLWMLLPIYVGFIVFKEFDVLSSLNRNIFIMILTGLTIVSGAILVNESFDGVVSKGGWGVASQYPQLRDLDHNYRVITDFRTLDWSVPQYYGLRSFDGFEASKSLMRENYIHYDLYIDESMAPVNSYAYSYFFFYDNDVPRYNLTGMAMANVKYVISRHTKITELGSVTQTLPGLRLLDYESNFAHRMIARVYGNFFLYPDVSIYEVPNPWGWVFVSTAEKVSQYSLKEKEYYKELLNIPFQTTLVSKEYKDRLVKTEERKSALKINSFRLVEGSFEILLNQGTGLVTVNQGFSKYWKATCDDRPMEVFPTNAIMMSVVVDRPCHRLYLNYDKKLTYLL